VAIFGAQAALRIAEHLYVYTLAVKVISNLPSRAEQGRKVLIRDSERSQSLLARGRLLRQRQLRQFLKIKHEYLLPLERRQRHKDHSDVCLIMV
jgi:hypothetical protein